MRKNGRQDEFSKECAARVLSTQQQVIDASPDGMIISTPSAMHRDTLFSAVEAHIPVYIEKPVLTTIPDVERLQALLDECPTLPSLIGCNLRFLPSLRLLRSLAMDGIGDIARASFEAGQWLPDWRPTQDYRQSYSVSSELGGGVILDLQHEFDVAEWICGPLQTLAASIGHVLSLEIESESVATVMLRNNDTGALVTVALDYVARKPLRYYRLIGDKATLVWSLADKALWRETATGAEKIDCDPEDFSIPNTYKTALAEFLASIREGKPTSNPLQSGLTSNILALRAKELVC